MASLHTSLKIRIPLRPSDFALGIGHLDAQPGPATPRQETPWHRRIASRALCRGYAPGSDALAGTMLGTMDKIQCAMYRNYPRGVSSARESAGIALQRSRVRIPYPPPICRAEQGRVCEKCAKHSRTRPRCHA